MPQSTGVLVGISSGIQSKKMFNLRKIVKKFSMNLKKIRWKFEKELCRELERKIEENSKDDESKL